MAAITSATSGLSTATSTWTGGVVPVLGDKVTIQHPGTNSQAAGTQYTSNTAGYAIGATSITLITGTGTILAGECVQFETSIGTDEDGAPIYDNTYYQVTTGITGPGTLVVAAPGLVVALPAAATACVNRGHVVRLAGTHSWGDDTSSTAAANNAVVVSGTLRASRSLTSSLTVRGTLMINDGGTLDFGATGDAMPAAITATLAGNDSATLAGGKHVITSHNRINPTWRIRGAKRSRNTRLTSATAAGATSITVDASLGWATGDRIVIASDTDNPNRAQIVTISAGASPTWTVGAITNARSAACRVGNLSSNVIFKATSAANPCPVAMHFGGSSASPKARVDVGDFRAENIGSVAGWSLINIPVYYGFGLLPVSLAAQTIHRVAAEANGLAGQLACFNVDGPSTFAHSFDDCAIHTVGRAVVAGNVGASRFPGLVTYSAQVDLYQTYGAMASCLLDGGEAWCSDAYTSLDSCYAAVVSNKTIHAVGLLAKVRLGLVTLDSCTVSAAGVSAATAINVTGGALIRNSTLSAGTLSGSNSTGGLPQQGQISTLVNVNGAASDNRVVGHYQTTVTDTATRKRGTYAVRIQPLVAGVAITYPFVIPAVAGVPQVIKGSLRFDTTYGTATPPVITLSGQGVTQSHIGVATANAWDDFSFSFTPTSTGDIAATVTVQSTSTAGFAWLDGIYHYPMTQAVRHFGYLWQPQAAQVVDARITLTEAAALAQPVAVNHGTSTITVTGAVTARQVFEACLADLCATANNALAVHISSSTGAEFLTVYTVVLSGAGAITGVYTDAAGTHVQITAPALVAGSRVQIYNITNGVEIYNGVLPATGLVSEAVYTANKTIRLRVDHATKLPLQTLGVLSVSGLTYLDVQADDTVYSANAIDGSTVTEFAADGVNVQVDINDPDGITSVQRLYAWMQYYQTTATGIASAFFGAMTASDSASYQIDQATANIQLDNLSTMPVRVIGGYLSRKDGSTIIAPASNSIQMDPGKAYVAPVSLITVPAGDRVITLQAAGKWLARG